MPRRIKKTKKTPYKREKVGIATIAGIALFHAKRAKNFEGTGGFSEYHHKKSLKDAAKFLNIRKK